MTNRRFGERAVDLMAADGLAVSGDRATYEIAIERLASAVPVGTRPLPQSEGSPGQSFFEEIASPEGPPTTGYLYICHAPDKWVRVVVDTTWS